MNMLLVSLLEDWNILNTAMSKMAESDIKEILNHECTHKRRSYFIERLHQRYCKLRKDRERDELLQGGTL